jgi:hypothetical protein
MILQENKNINQRTAQPRVNADRAFARRELGANYLSWLRFKDGSGPNPPGWLRIRWAAW